MTVTENSTEIVTDNDTFVDTETYNIVDYILAIYENKWNVIGKKDIIWYKNTDIKCKLNTLAPSGKSGRMYKLESAELDKISSLDDM